MNAVGLVILAVLLPSVLFAPARWALLAILAGVLFLTQGQQVSVGGLHLFAMRFIEMAAVVRVILRRELRFSTLNQIDRALLILYLYTTLVFLLRSPDGQAFAIGVAIDAFFCYFSFRALITGVDDYKWFLRAFVLLLLPYVGLIVFENVTTRNPFASMGGFVLGADGTFDVDTWSRGGRLRSYGSFRHPSLLGTLGGTFLPLYIGLCFDNRRRVVSVTGMVLCLAIVWASNSGGPATCVAVAVAGWLLWMNRAKMYLVRRSLVAIVVFAAIFMKAPVWYLIARFSPLTGGDGYHRSYLLDVSFQHLSQWWLAGMRTEDTAGWFPYSNSATGGADLTNQFIVFGIGSGLGSVILLVALLTFAYRRLGQSLAVLGTEPDNRATEYLYWGVGVMLTVHTVNWLGVSYFDQTYVIWFMHLAIIATLSDSVLSGAQVIPQGDRPSLMQRRGRSRRTTVGRLKPVRKNRPTGALISRCLVG